MDDGGQVSLDWFVSPHGKGDGPPAIAVIVPGLTGSSQTEYVKSLVPELAAAGYTCVGFNQRSRGGTRLLTPRLYCAANCDDLKHALSHIRDQRPNSLIVAIGVSLGGIQLTRYLVQSGSASVVDAAILVSVIFDLIRANETLEQFGLNYLFNRALTSGVLKIADEERDMLQQAEGIDYNQVTQSKTLRQLDGSFTAPMFGYSGAEEYYRAASNAGQLHHVRIPTLCLSSADDFISPGPILPLQEIRRSRHVAMILTQRGGHIGFMDGLFPSLPFFSERLIGQYAAALLKLSDVRKELAP